MKILIATDSFKGSLTSKEVCECIENRIKNTDSSIETKCIPMADGGEGFAACIADNCKGEWLYAKAHNIYNQEIECPIYTSGDTAFIECASASGLLKRKMVMQASTYGTGELIKYAAQNGFVNIVLGLGGSGSCDGGLGALSALGVKVYDENWNVIARPKSNDMNFVFGMDFKSIVKPISFTFACDVENEYFGKNGAAYVFAPQKGARKTDVEELDEGLKRINAFFKDDLSKVKGSGAAGGLCGGLYAVYGGKIKSGFDILCDYTKLEDEIKNADIIVTGEGKTDSQTLMGKLPFKICELAKKHNKECVIISGMIDGVKLGDRMISLVDDSITSDEAMTNAKKILTQKAKYILK